MSENLVEVKHLQQYFPAGGMGKNKQYVQAVDDVSFAIRKGETLGLVGESGCGKTTTGRTLLRLYEPTDGTIIYDGKVLFDKKEKIAVDMLPYRRRMQIVFQDPYASLDPRMTIGDIVGEGIDIHHLCANAKERHDKIISLLERVGLNSEHANRYPHEFSGGQRQRVGIARALAVDPEFIVCDEPVSALDVSIQAQVVNMFEDLQQEMGLTYLFIAHDLSVVKHISNRIGVMYLGKLVELADSFELIAHSVHPYTRSLISAIPVADPVTARQSHRIVLQGDVPSPLNPPSGCRFRTRCPYADERCAAEVPEFREVSGGQRQRVGIARALAVNPEFIVCDEPVSALDVSIQAQVVNMFEDLQQEMGLTYLFIAHDLSVVKHISNRIGVMYLGKLVELADSYELIAHSIHPYTRSLISAIPVADPITARQSKRIVLQGDVPSPLNPPSGCRFRTRCPYADERCAAEVPEFKEVTSGHWAACHHLDKVK